MLKTEESQPFLYTAYFEPMPFEVDFTGNLSNTVAVRWMETLRVQMMRAHFSEMDTGLPENLSVIAKTQVFYLKVIRFGDSITGAVWISNMSKSSWSVSFSFCNIDKNETAMRGEQTGVFLNPKSFRPTRVPEIIRQRYSFHTRDLLM